MLDFSSSAGIRNNSAAVTIGVYNDGIHVDPDDHEVDKVCVYNDGVHVDPDDHEVDKV